MQQETEQIDQYVMLQIATWIDAILFQGHRLLASGPNAITRIPRALQTVEEEFFVVAVRRLLRWANEGKSRYLVAHNEFDALFAFEQTVIDLRDMREHADDYIVRKKGRKQDKFHYSATGKDGSPLYSSDATATVVLEGNYMIGGRLSVQSVMTATEHVRQGFRFRILADQRFGWIAN